MAHVQLLLAAAILVLTGETTEGQISIPSRRLGFVYPGGINQEPHVEIGVYLDPTCPDSRDVYGTLFEVVGDYQPDQVQLRMHLHNLPYHRNSHTIAKAAHVLEDFAPNNNTAFTWIQVVYDNLNSLTGWATADMKDSEVVNTLSLMAYKLTGIEQSSFKTKINDYQFDGPARQDFKYGCTRGVHSTPMFTINDVFVPANTWNLRTWKLHIDPLL